MNLLHFADLPSNGASFKVISDYRLPLPIEPARIHIYHTPYHSPFILIPARGGIRASSIVHFGPRKPPPFPEPVPDGQEADEQLAEATNRMHIVDATSRKVDDEHSPLMRWFIKTGSGDGEVVKLKACAMSENGRMLIAVGEKEGIWIWRAPRPS